jgi:hypothetical protein
MKETKLKPVIFEKGRYNFHSQGLFQQNVLLKAMQVTSNPEELRKMAGMKTVAEVYRTLDKLAIRKEYHEALVRNGVDLDYVVGGIKKICENAISEPVKLAGYKTLLKSLGLEEYKEEKTETGKNWEELIRDMVQKESDGVKDIDVNEYEVLQPEMPEEERAKRLIEKEEGRSIYDE